MERLTAEGSRTDTATARNAPLSTPTGVNSIPFRRGSSPNRGGVAGAFLPLHPLGRDRAGEVRGVEKQCQIGMSSLPCLN